jgi:hypothetical protein
MAKTGWQVELPMLLVFSTHHTEESGSGQPMLTVALMELAMISNKMAGGKT